MMHQQKVRPKKFLGQHFLHDEHIARKITEALLVESPYTKVLEIGPGMGVLTKYLIQNPQIDLTVVEIDRESVAFLKNHYPTLSNKIIDQDFLELDNHQLFPTSTAVIGNFPYNISSQIFFKILENRNLVSQVVCMLQKEVADRIASKHGNKTYGILSVLLQTFYKVEMILKVPPGVFTPPPKVMSAVIRLVRNERQALPCDEKLFFTVVKTGFNQRRKTLRNALKNLSLAAHLNSLPVLDKRAEQLSVDDFITLTTLIERSRAGDDGI
ncbi:MAG: 16S rRNA (adenine(1518)-N(6)/adenine(1519)-N(6))-dimethyltransferase RsmA [Cyclobacteriaceae bacterium]|jgi:16S rRNA (adenine1518-N6/adenine1519-N6)-dimethyltransferase|nr:16S rRNA (adenine(1518)-N(6)/adenine(1519)-N(6))-dimethyltransferase RsmA [Cyclobacteriaceae bacterium]